MNIKTKIVYILGAGFSKEANAPSQEELVKNIFETYNDSPRMIGIDKMEEFKDFLNFTLHIPESLQETIPLEDIFTPLDRCIADNTSFGNLSVDELRKKRELIFELIGKTLQYKLQDADNHYIEIFAKYLIEQSKKRAKGEYSRVDPVSVISTNWDIILDNSIHNNINGGLNNIKGVVDYCCYISSYDKSDHTIKPALEILGKGGYNVKLLKLHGSLNWLQCPKCQRLYVKFNEKIAMNPYGNDTRPTCRHCNKNFDVVDNEKSHRLFSNLIMPTFLKDLSNPQYKIIWQNAGIELSEAKKIVFIGYSLPQADFEMRQLLSRMVDKRTEIEVVDFRSPNDNGQAFDKLIKAYKQFFGRNVTSYEYGAANYIKNEIEPQINIKHNGR
jgi:hypothetical protein